MSSIPILGGLASNAKTAFDKDHIGGTVGTLSNAITNLGNGISGHSAPPQAFAQGQTPTMVHPGTLVPIGTPVPLSQAVAQGNGTPMATTSQPSTGTIAPVPMPQVPGVTMQAGDNNSLFGNDTGGTLTNLFNSEGSTGANTMAQNLINANMPNVMKGQANLQANLAASGISPSSSVSAIENADYMGGVENNNLGELAQVNLKEQQMQQQLLEDTLPSQQQREVDSSGWSIFGDVMQGLGPILSAPLTAGAGA